MTNKANNVFYIGVTSDLIKRAYEHKYHLVEGFTDKYNLEKLVLYEIYEDVNEAIKREKQLKRWHRQWKINLIKQINAEFKDLYETLF